MSVEMSSENDISINLLKQTTLVQQTIVFPNTGIFQPLRFYQELQCWLIERTGEQVQSQKREMRSEYLQFHPILPHPYKKDENQYNCFNQGLSRSWQNKGLRACGGTFNKCVN